MPCKKKKKKEEESVIEEAEEGSGEPAQAFIYAGVRV
jgi:hypothetical protein